MADQVELEGELGPREYFAETQALIDRLYQEPTIPLFCSHGDGSGAIGVYEVPRGCVALPGLETQCLCPQHRISNGSFEGMIAVVDLTVNGGWSRHIGDEFDFYHIEDTDTGKIRMVTAEEFAAITNPLTDSNS